jgi:hypothetical protein
MKFNYDIKPDERECKAYIDENGDLVIRYDVEGKEVFMFGDCSFNPYNSIYRFYPGDSITITFE